MNPVQIISLSMKILTVLSTIAGTLGASGLLGSGTASSVVAEAGGFIGVALGFLHSITSNTSASIQQQATDLATNAPRR